MTTEDPNREKETFSCPKCGFGQVESLQECPKCGIVFWKYALLEDKLRKNRPDGSISEALVSQGTLPAVASDLVGVADDTGGHGPAVEKAFKAAGEVVETLGDLAEDGGEVADAIFSILEALTNQ